MLMAKSIKTPHISTPERVLMDATDWLTRLVESMKREWREVGGTAGVKIELWPSIINKVATQIDIDYDVECRRQ